MMFFRNFWQRSGWAKRGAILVFGIATTALLSPAHAQLQALVTNRNDNNVSAIDIASQGVVQTIPVGTAPNGIAADDVFNRVYVANSGSASVTRINLANGQVDSINIPGALPESIGVADEGNIVVVTSMERVSLPGGGSAGRVHLVDVSGPTMTLIDSLLVEDDPEGVVVSPAGDDFWFASDLKIQQVELDVLPLSVSDVITGIETVDDYEHVAVLPDESTLYATNDLRNRVEVIDLSTENILASVSTGIRPEFVFLRPNSTEVHVTNQGDNTITVFSQNAPFGGIGSVALSGISPGGLAFLPDGSEGYVAMSGSSSVIRYNAATRTEIATIPVGDIPEEIVILDVETAPTIAPNPDSFDFGLVPVGGSVNGSVDLVNAGQTVATVSGFNVTGLAGGDFSVNTAVPFTVAPGVAVSVGLTFAPTALGVRSASLEVVSDDPTGPTAVPLTGSGIQAPLGAGDWEFYR